MDVRSNVDRQVKDVCEVSVGNHEDVGKSRRPLVCSDERRGKPVSKNDVPPGSRADRASRGPLPTHRTHKTQPQTLPP